MPATEAGLRLPFQRAVDSAAPSDDTVRDKTGDEIALQPEAMPLDKWIGRAIQQDAATGRYKDVATAHQRNGQVLRSLPGCLGSAPQ